MGPEPAMDPSGDLRARSTRGGLLSVATRGLSLVFTIAATMVLARLLTPGDFGLVAMAVVLTGFVSSFRDFGLPLAVVREGRIDHDLLSRVFWVNARLTALLGLAVAAASPLLARLFGEPSLIPLTCALAFGMTANGLSLPQLALLKRRLRFRVVGTVDVAAVLSGGACGIAAALLGLGFWALVIQQVVELLVQGGLLWVASDWRPGSLARYGRAGSQLRSVFSFGRDTTAVRVLGGAADHLDRLLVGSLAGAVQLGFYQTARRWSDLPALQLVVPLKSVAVASFSRLQDDPERYRSAARAAFAAAFAAVLPLMSFLCVEAEDVILFLVGSQWLPAVPLFQLLVVAAAFRCVSRMLIWVYLSEGQTRRRLYWTLVYRPLTIAAILAGAPWGPLGIAVASAAVFVLLAWPAVRFCLRTSPLRESDFWGAAWRPALAGVGAAAVLYALDTSSAPLVPLRLLRDGAIFALACAGIWLLLPGGVASARELWGLLRSAGPSREAPVAAEAAVGTPAEGGAAGGRR